MAIDEAGETGTLEDLAWMYDRKAAELVHEEGSYDMFF